MQLRDDIPGILFPGCWAFFGGHLDPGEDADTAIYRELEEEISYQAPHLELFSRVEEGNVIRNVYHGPLVVSVSDLQLNEGWDMALWSVEDIHQGERYSEKAGAMKPMEAPHRNILRSFLEHRRIEQAS
jgi:8-oxo-dGTP pyrophosphatase MutT (NUDIX family)